MSGRGQRSTRARGSAGAGGSRLDLRAQAEQPRRHRDRLRPHRYQFAGGRQGRPGRAGLLRSIFMKGLAALVFESVPAAERIGAGAWIRDELAGELGPGGPELVEGLLSGTRRHAERRQHEMQDVQAFLSTLHTPAWMTESTIRWLRAIAAGEA